MPIKCTLVDTKDGIYLVEEETGRTMWLPVRKWVYTCEAGSSPKAEVELTLTGIKCCDTIETYLTERLKDKL